MGRDRINKRCFTRNTNGRNTTQPYVFCVDLDLAKVPGSGVRRNGSNKPKCTAKKGSQGYDNLTTYVYQLIVVNGNQEKIAYVECDYVK